MFDVSNSHENHKIKFITEDIKNNLIYNSSANPLIKLKNFDVQKNIIGNYSLDSNTNNKIMVLKNNKKVYINSYLLNSYSVSRNIKKLKKLIL